MIRQSLPLVSEVTSGNFRELISMGVSALIAYVDEGDQESRTLFTSFAESHQNDYILGITSDMSLAEQDVSHTPFLILFNPLDQVKPKLEGDFNHEKIEDFIVKHATPLIGTFSLETYYVYTEVSLICQGALSAPFMLLKVNLGRNSSRTRLCPYRRRTLDPGKSP